MPPVLAYGLPDLRSDFDGGGCTLDFGLGSPAISTQLTPSPVITFFSQPQNSHSSIYFHIALLELRRDQRFGFAPGAGIVLE
jgi:hypothetical protein